MGYKLRIETPVRLTDRVTSVRTMFDLPLVDKTTREWDVNIPDDDVPWNVGLFVGPSGSGKTRLAREFFPDAFAENYSWPHDASVMDGFDPSITTEDVTKLLSAVGFASPPSWLQPFHTLSNGEQFRANLARAIVDPRDVVVIDEFTSVVDRTVAQIGSAAFARSVRARNRKVILLSCHYDVIDWLQPDWIYRVDSNEFERRSLQRRPPVEIEVHQCSRKLWEVFGKHHYLTNKLPGGSHCMVGLVGGRPAVFVANQFFPASGDMVSGIRNIARVVALPDFQGIGLGNAMNEFCASLWAAQGWRVHIVLAHPQLYGHMIKRNDLWKLVRKPAKHTGGCVATDDGRWLGKSGMMFRSGRRTTATFAYVGPPGDVGVARQFEVHEHPLKINATG